MTVCVCGCVRACVRVWFAGPYVQHFLVVSCVTFYPATSQVHDLMDIGVHLLID